MNPNTLGSEGELLESERSPEQQVQQFVHWLTRQNRVIEESELREELPSVLAEGSSYEWSVFFQELTAILESMDVYQSRDDMLRAATLSENVEYLLRELHPRALEQLSLPEHLGIAARSTSLPITKDFIGQAAMQSLAHRLETMEESDQLDVVRYIEDTIRNTSVARGLNILHLLASIASQIMSDDPGEDVTRARALYVIDTVLAHLIEDEPCAFIGITAQAVQAQVRELHSNPSARGSSFSFTRTRNSFRGEYSKQMPEGTLSRKDRTRMILESEGLTQGKLQSIASDAAGLVDNSQRLSVIAPLQNVPTKTASDGHALGNAQRMKLAKWMREHVEPETMKDITTILEEQNMLPFDGSYEETAELLAHLHDLTIYWHLRKDAGIDIHNLPLRTQVHLLRYLATQKSERLAQLKEELERKPQMRQALLSSFLACAEDETMGDIILNFSYAEECNMVLLAYQRFARTAEQTAEELARSYADINPEYDAEFFYRRMLVRANNLMRNLQSHVHTRSSDEAFKGDREQLAQECARKIAHENVQVQQLQYLVGSLEEDEIKELPITQLTMTSMHGPFTGAELREHPAYPQIQKIIRAQFPKEDEPEFSDQFLSNPASRIYFSECAGEVLGMFGLTRMTNGAEYIDWYAANPDAPVKGLAQATMVGQIQRLDMSKGMYAVTAPHVASSTTIIERLGCVVFGKADEYSKTYMRLRLLSEELDAYEGKHLKEVEIRSIRHLCDADPETLIDASINGTDYKVCRVSFQNRTHEHDIGPDSEDGFVYRAITELCADNQWVMSRYIPHADNTRTSQVHYCVFERSKLSNEEERRMQQSIHDLHSEHHVGSMK